MEDTEVKTEALSLIKKLKKIFANGIKLSPKERRAMPGMGESRAEFVKAVISIIQKEDGFLSRNFNKVELTESFRRCNELKEIKKELEELSAYVNDRCIQSGTDTLILALSVKRMLDNNPAQEYDEYREELRKYFTTQRTDKVKVDAQ